VHGSVFASFRVSRGAIPNFLRLGAEFDERSLVAVLHMYIIPRRLDLEVASIMIKSQLLRLLVAPHFPAGLFFRPVVENFGRQLAWRCNRLCRSLPNRHRFLA